jgi:PleD family two-component response regulator
MTTAAALIRTLQPRVDISAYSACRNERNKLNGTLTIESAAATGTTVRVLAPAPSDARTLAASKFMRRKTRVLIVDDHAMMRLGLAEAITGERDMTLAGEAANGEQALALYRKLQPDVVTMDFQMPGKGRGGVDRTAPG